MYHPSGFHRASRTHARHDALFMSVLEYVFQEENNNDNNNDNTNTNNFEFPGHPTLGHDERKNKKKKQCQRIALRRLSQNKSRGVPTCGGDQVCMKKKKSV
jgi:hypothetical protein